MEVREAVEAEWPPIADLTRSAYAVLTPDPDDPSWVAYQQSTRTILLDPHSGRRLVVDVGGTVVASVLLCPPSEERANGHLNPYPEMRLLAVRDDFRLRGLGGLLIAACEQRARQDGYAAITLHTTVLMPTAKAMYERRGYQRAPELDFPAGPELVVWGYRRLLT